MVEESGNTSSVRPRRLSTVWLVSPVLVGIVFLIVAGVGNYRWGWSSFATGAIVNFASSISLVSVWFLFERRFEKREDALRRSYAVFRRTDARREHVTDALNALLVTLSENESVHIADLACSVYLVDGHLMGGQELRLLCRASLAPSPMSAVRWTRGKGVIGRCWQTEATIYTNLHAVNERTATISEADYHKLSESARMNLTYDESRRTVGKYGEILAVPILKEGRFAGCLATNIRESGRTGADSVLGSNRATEAVTVAARVVGFLL